MPGDEQRQRLARPQFNVQLAAKNLKPEKSKNFTLGTVLEPMNNFTFGVDYFRVHLDEHHRQRRQPGDHPRRHGAVRRASSPGHADAGRHRRRHPGQITRSTRSTSTSARPRFPASTSTSWRIPTAEMGRFTVSGTATYFIKFDTSNTDGPSPAMSTASTRRRAASFHGSRATCRSTGRAGRSG
jgi:hypothetical protein